MITTTFHIWTLPLHSHTTVLKPYTKIKRLKWKDQALENSKENTGSARVQQIQPHLIFFLRSEVFLTLWLNPQTDNYTQRYTCLHNCTNHHLLTSQSWTACYHGNKQSSVQSYRYWSTPCGLEIAAFQHTEHTPFFLVYVSSHSHSLSSIPSELQSLSMAVQRNGSLLSQ